MKPISKSAARLSFAGASFFAILLCVLHLLKPDLDPSWHFISEYAIGRYGFLMSLAFLSLSASYVALFVTLRGQLPSIGGRVGRVLLIASALGLALGGFFTTDPLLTPPDQMTVSGQVHALGGAIGMVMPFASLLVGRGLLRNPAWSGGRGSLIAATGAACLGFVFAFGSMVVLMSESEGTFGPNVPVGWPNRLEILGYTAWMMVVSRLALTVARREEG